jgi:hypothetical protein
MNRLIIFLILTVLIFPAKAMSDEKKDKRTDTSVIQGLDLEITLFESMEIIKNYIKEKNLKFEGMYLHSVTLEYIKEHPKKGLCWHYAWRFKIPSRGGEISIFHYMDGTIIVHHHGP